MSKEWNVKIDGRGMEHGEIISSLLESRGIEDVHRFLTPTKEDLIPLNCLINIDQASKIIVNTIQNDGTFMIYYDVDTDGITSGTIMTRYLKNYTNKIKTYINVGKQHGIVDFSLDNLRDIDTLIIVDSIDGDPESYQKILDLGVTVCVFDHHIIPNQLIQNPVDICLVSSANRYLNSELSGAGVTWKVCKYIDYLTLNDFADDLVDLAAVGLIADMSSVGVENTENRYICYQGLNHLNNVGIKQINRGYPFDATSVSFGIAPLINACNRVCDNRTAVDLFLSDDPKEVNKLIWQLKADKDEQNEAVDSLMPDLIAQAEEQINEKCLYCKIPNDIEVSVTGLLGNKLLELYQRPLFVLQDKIEVDNETGEITKHELRGSMRATGIDNFKKYIDAISDQYHYCWSMGHELAAGFGCDADKFDHFKQMINASLLDVEFVQYTDVDIILNEDQITDHFIRQLTALNTISGKDFPAITVMVSGIKDYQLSFMSGGKHLKCETPNLTYIKWNCGDSVEGEFTAIGTLALNCFGKKLTKQMIMSDYVTERI